jgi:hypothetical protein
LENCEVSEIADSDDVEVEIEADVEQFGVGATEVGFNCCFGAGSIELV